MHKQIPKTFLQMKRIIAGHNILKGFLYLAVLMSNICQPYLNVLLCGDLTLTFVQNKQIFNAVQEFIIKSKRFEYTH